MTETKTTRRRTRAGYVSKPRATHITLYSPSGQPVPRAVLNEAARAVEAVAAENDLLVNVTEG